MKNPIYKPRGKAAEYSHLALNLYDGCDNGCLFCYAPAVLHKSREEFAKCKPREGIIKAIRRQLETFEVHDFFSRGNKYSSPKPRIDKRVLLCFTCDPYPSAGGTATTQRAISMLSKYDIPFQVLTKSGSRALKDISMYGPNDAFASTLTFINPEDSKKWEPNAALPEDRMATLCSFHEAGIHTWVSLEPVIDPEQTLELIRQTANFVDLYKLGKLNYTRSGFEDWQLYGKQAIELLESLDKPYFIKSDLAKYLKGIPFTNTDNRSIQPQHGKDFL